MLPSELVADSLAKLDSQSGPTESKIETDPELRKIAEQMTAIYRMQGDMFSKRELSLQDRENLQCEYEVARQSDSLLSLLFGSQIKSKQSLKELWEPSALFDALFISRSVISTASKLFKIAQLTCDQ